MVLDGRVLATPADEIIVLAIGTLTGPQTRARLIERYGILYQNAMTPAFKTRKEQYNAA